MHAAPAGETSSSQTESLALPKTGVPGPLQTPAPHNHRTQSNWPGTNAMNVPSKHGGGHNHAQQFQGSNELVATWLPGCRVLARVGSTMTRMRRAPRSPSRLGADPVFDWRVGPRERPPKRKRGVVKRRAYRRKLAACDTPLDPPRSWRFRAMQDPRKCDGGGAEDASKAANLPRDARVSTTGLGFCPVKFQGPASVTTLGYECNRRP